MGSDENPSCNTLAWVTLQAQAGQAYAVAVGDSCESFGGLITLHILPLDAPAQIADAHIRKAGEFWNVPVFEFFAVGMREPGWTVEYSDDLQSWTVCDDEFPYGWADGVSNWADTFHAQTNPSGSSRFFRLHRAY
jgi:hypothetical protein